MQGYGKVNQVKKVRIFCICPWNQFHEKFRDNGQINDFYILLYFFHRKENLGNDPDVLKLVREQTTQWTDLMHRQRKSEWEMLKTHVTAQEETLKKLASQLQVKQMKDLEANFTK